MDPGEYVYSQHKNRSPFIAGGIVFVAVLVGILSYTINNRPQSTQPTLIIPTETAYVSPTEGPINADPSPPVVATNRPDANFSYKHPQPRNCNGCYDGSGSNETGLSSSISSSTTLSTYDPEEWNIEVLKLPTNLKGTYSYWSIPDPRFFSIGEALKVGETATVTKPDGKTFTIRREKNIALYKSQLAHVYISNYSAKNLKQTKYAVMEEGGYTYVLAVTWTDPAFDYVYELLTLTFQLELYPTPSVTGSSTQ